MEKRLLYICPRRCVTNRFIYYRSYGIQKKIDFQRFVFEQAGYKVKYGIIDPLPSNIFASLDKVNIFSCSRTWKDISIDMPLDVIYIRFDEVIELDLILLLKAIKRKNRNIKILFEFQTYPFKKDYYYKDNASEYYKLLFWKRLLKCYVDRIILCCPGYKRLFGIKVIYMPNGVKYRKETIIPRNHEKNEIHLIAVSSMLDSHAYDRLIKGMGVYYKKKRKREVILHLVGDGGMTNEYINLVNTLRITGYVVFEGFCIGERLEHLYLLSDIGIDCFGMHRGGQVVSSGLKLKESASYGLPIIGAGRTDLDYKECMKYLLKFPENDTDIDVGQIVEFYDRVYTDDKQIVRNKIKKVFRPYYDIQKTMKGIVDYMEE